MTLRRTLMTMALSAPVIFAQFPDDYRYGNGRRGGNGYGSLRIIQAEYGWAGRYVDVTRQLSRYSNGDSLQVRVENGTFGIDPYRGADKEIRVTYEYRGQRLQARVREGDTLYLPQSGNWGGGPGYGNGYGRPGEWGRNGALFIVSARYGDDGRYMDVTRRLQSYVRGDSLRVRVENHTMGGDPYRGEDKRLYVVYEYRGQRFETRVREYDDLILPNFNDRSVRYGGY